MSDLLLKIYALAGQCQDRQDRDVPITFAAGKASGQKRALAIGESEGGKLIRSGVSWRGHEAEGTRCKPRVDA